MLWLKKKLLYADDTSALATDNIFNILKKNVN